MRTTRVGQSAPIPSVASAAAPAGHTPTLVGDSQWMNDLRQRIARAAPFRSTVLITGPSGTGKELIARAIHEQSDRRGGAFVPVDCTALSGELFASHLFGHERGAFTGAHTDRLGCFRAADGGTILLDEIGEMSLELQAKLLRTIQERVVVPLGSERPMPVDVRIVAATNRDLADEVRCGRFRLDLYYRLNVVSIQTLPLCERREEIATLANYFANRFAAQQGLPRKSFSSAALRALGAYAWPGNVRELENVVERASIFSSGDEIVAEDIPFDRPTVDAAAMPAVAEAVASPREAAWCTLAEVERRHICATLSRALYNQSLAARMLKIDRASLARKIERYAIALPEVRRGRPKGRSFPA